MESFSSDHNMIVEEFGFYQLLPPREQTFFIDFLFEKFLEKF